MRKLPNPSTKGVISVEEAIAGRRSVRSFTGERLSDHALSQILWAAQGITEKAHEFRAAPSAGATFPLSAYVVTQEGIFLYLPDVHGLEEIRQGDVRKDLAKAAFGQEWMWKAGAVVALVASPERTTGRYGSRGEMYIHMEAGHAAENIHLQAVALGLGSTAVGAFDDRAVAGVIGLRGGEEPLYLVPVGKPA